MKSSNTESFLRQSFVFNTGTNAMNRSYISTSLMSDSMAYGDDLRKSRIQNLPNYKKTNLGAAPNFIIVFQAIEIERLSSQLQFLRVRLKESERQLFNAQNYEVQIRELTQKCFSLQRERQEYREQLDKLNKICETLYHQNEMLKNRLSDIDISLKQKYESEKNKNSELMQDIEKWKSRYQAVEKSKARELEDLRNLMECQRKSMIDREIREITIRFQNQRSSLENQIRKNREIMQNRNRELDDYRQKYQKSQITIIQLKNYENIISDNENKIVLLNQQQLRLNQILRDRQLQNNELRQTTHNLHQKITNQNEWEFQMKQLTTSLEHKSNECNQWKTRTSRLQDQMHSAKQLQIYIEELRNKLNVVSKELERLNNLLKAKMDEVQQWKKRYSQKEMEVGRYKNLENQVGNYQVKISNIKFENQRINGILKSRLSEIQDGRLRYNQLEAKMSQFSMIDKDKKVMQDRFNDQIRQNEQFQFKINKLQNEINTYKKVENQWNDISRQNETLTKQIDRLNKTLSQSSATLRDNQTKQNRMQQSLKEYRNIETKMNDFQNKIALLMQQIERLNDLIKHKNSELNNLEQQKLHYHSKLSYYKNYEVKLQQNESALQRLKQNLSKSQRQLEGQLRGQKSQQNRIQQLEKHLFQNTQQKQKLSSMMKSKNNEVDDLRLRCSRMEGDGRRVSELQIILQEQHGQMMGIVADGDAVGRKLAGVQNQLEKEKQFTNQFAIKIIVLSSQIDRLTSSTTVSSKQHVQLKNHNDTLQKTNSTMQQSYANLQQSHGALQQQHNDLTSKYTIITSKSSNLQSSLASLNSTISTLTIKIQSLQSQYKKLLQYAEMSHQETVALEKRIEQYQDYAKRIHILGAEIDRLRGQKQGLDGEVKGMRLRYAEGVGQEGSRTMEALRIVLMGVQIDGLRARIDQREVREEDMRKSILEPVRRI